MRSAFCVVAAGLIAGACSDGGGTALPDSGLVEDAGGTPDNCTETMACALTAGTMGTDYVAPVGDDDRWTINVPSTPTIMQVVVSNDADFSPIRLQVALLDPDGTAVTTQSFNGNGKQRITLQLVAQKVGTYTIVVRDSGDDAQDRRNPYFVVVSILPDSDNNEPNDELAMATPLTLGMGTVGSIGFQGDEDWYSVQVGANQLVQVTLSFTTAPVEDGVRFKYVLFDSAGMMPIAASVEPGGTAREIRELRAVGNAAGTYYIQVIDEEGTHADLMRTYVLSVSLIPEPDVQDLAAPNDVAGMPTTAMPGQTITAYIASTADQDWYDIRVRNAPALITVEATMDPASPVDIAFTVFELDGHTEVCESEGICRAFRFVPETQFTRPMTLSTSHVVRTAGRYLVMVRDFQDNEYDTARAYTLRIDTPAEPDAAETYDDPPPPNDREQPVAPLIPAATATTGTTIQFPWVEGYISYAGDVDWWAFEIPGPVGAAPGQNGDWLIQLDIQTNPTPIELQLFMYSIPRNYGGFGEMCRMPEPGDPDLLQLACQYPDAENAQNESFGEAFGQCIVFFRESTSRGLHWVRITDLNRDDFDLVNRYRFRMTLTARCPAGSLCTGVYLDGGRDLCGRP